MTPRKIAAEVAREAADRIGALIEANMVWHRAHPYVAYKWHDTLAKALPRWRWAARAYHRAMARRMWALSLATQEALKCQLAEARGYARG